jgi:hypothetical protein
VYVILLANRHCFLEILCSQCDEGLHLICHVTLDLELLALKSVFMLLFCWYQFQVEDNNGLFTCAVCSHFVPHHHHCRNPLSWICYSQVVFCIHALVLYGEQLLLIWVAWIYNDI